MFDKKTLQIIVGFFSFFIKEDELASHSQPCTTERTNWPTLMVINPITNQFTVLPCCNGVLCYAWNDSDPCFSMVENEKSNNYNPFIHWDAHNNTPSQRCTLNWNLCTTYFGVIVLYNFRRLQTWSLVCRCIRPWESILGQPMSAYSEWSPFNYLPAAVRLFRVQFHMHFITVVLRLFKVDLGTGRCILSMKSALSEGVQHPCEYLKNKLFWIRLLARSP